MSTDIATTVRGEVVLPSESGPKPLKVQIRDMEHQFALAAPRGMEARQIVRDALTALSQNPDLARCDAQSVLGGLMTMAQLGLRVGVLGHGWLIPFWDRQSRSHKAQLVIGYQGLVELAYRSGRIAKITKHTVYEHDHFSREYGSDEKLIHRPASGDRGKPVYYYATVKIVGVAEAMFFDMSHEEMEAYRDRYAMAKKKDGTIVGPWRDNFQGMAEKTCLRQLSKLMPKGTDLALALAADDSVRVDLSPTADIAQVSHHMEAEQVAASPHVTEEDFNPATGEVYEAPAQSGELFGGEQE